MERFVELVQGPEADLPLDEAALLIAAAAYPGLDIGAELARLDALAASCGVGGLDRWRRCLYVQHGFAGNVVDYYDPRNSFLTDVLSRRTGIPITLAVVGIEVGRRMGVVLSGVGMPMHFLLRHLGDPPVFVDPFDGVLLDEAGCRLLFTKVAGPVAPFDPSYLDPTGPRAILARMLANLKQIYARRGEFLSLAWVLRLRLAIPGVPLDERAELSRALAWGGQFVQAAIELEELARLRPVSAEELRRRARGLRARTN